MALGVRDDGAAGALLYYYTTILLNYYTTILLYYYTTRVGGFVGALLVGFRRAYVW